MIIPNVEAVADQMAYNFGNRWTDDRHFPVSGRQRTVHLADGVPW